MVKGKDGADYEIISADNAGCLGTPGGYKKVICNCTDQHNLGTNYRYNFL